jgi:hypothetical protein
MVGRDDRRPAPDALHRIPVRRLGLWDTLVSELVSGFELLGADAAQMAVPA